jgi:hypothetical protein
MGSGVTPGALVAGAEGAAGATGGPVAKASSCAVTLSGMEAPRRSRRRGASTAPEKDVKGVEGGMGE